MFLQIPGTRTLKHLDGFLRDEWLECCGHLSQFIIGGLKYDSNPESAEYERVSSMNYKLQSVLQEKMIFDHEYDFGTTTYLKLKVSAANIPPVINKKGIVLLAVHDKVQFKCDVCGKEATRLCPYCPIHEDSGLLCDKCADEHMSEYGDDVYLLDVVQSPRMGECAYDRHSTLHDALSGTTA